MIPKPQSVAAKPSQLEKLFSKGCCHIGDGSDTILITGSIYLIAEVLTILEGHDEDSIGQDLI